MTKEKEQIIRAVELAVIGSLVTSGAIAAVKAVPSFLSNFSKAAAENNNGNILPTQQAYDSSLRPVTPVEQEALVTATLQARSEPILAVVPPTVTEVKATATIEFTNTPIPTEIPPTSTPTIIPDTATPLPLTATPTATAIPATETPTKIPITNTPKPPTAIPPTATQKVEVTATTKVEPSNTSVLPTVTQAPEQPPTRVPPTSTPKTPDTVTPTQKKEAPAAAFPKEIGSLEQGFAVHNTGTKFGIVPRDLDYIFQMAQKYGVKIEYFVYDNHTDNPYSQQAYAVFIHRNPNGGVISCCKEASFKTQNGVIRYYLSFDDNFIDIVSGEIFPDDKYAQSRKQEVERGNSGVLANSIRLKAPRSEWPKSFGAAPADVWKISNPIPNLQLAISP